MNIKQLTLINERVKSYTSKNGDLKDFTKIINHVLKKDKALLERQLSLIDFKELVRDMVSLRVAINRISGWADTIDIMTNPEEYEYLMLEEQADKTQKK